MFFVDTIGYFALLSLLIQCGLAWVFVLLFGALWPRRAPWMHSLFAGFLGLAMGLTAVSVRFGLAHHAIAGASTLQEGSPAVRLFYGLYLAGKVLFVVGLHRGVMGLCSSERIVPPRRRPWRLGGLLLVAFAIGVAVPIVESLLLLQGPVVAWVALSAARRLRRRPGEPDEAGRATVRLVLLALGIAWIAYGLAAADLLVRGERMNVALALLLRLNSALDLLLQVALAGGLIVAVLVDANRKLLRAIDERERLRGHIARDDRLRTMATLVSGVAHEINNPLTAILGFADDLTAPEPEARERAARIVREQAERCRSIVQRMSVLGRRRTLSWQVFDAMEMTQRVANGMQPQFREAGVRLRIAASTSDPEVSADVTGFEQVVTNLLANALHVSPRGGEVELTLTDTDDAMLLAVRDAGPGIPAELRERIFEPFFTTKPDGRGTGLGLAVVEAIVHAHAGRISIEDALGGGTRFVVSWPARPARGPSEPAGAIEVPPKVPGRRLLVVDDEPVVRKTVARHAQGHGWQVLEADGVDAALAVLFEPGQRFDAIVCDLRMPGRSGAELHDELASRAPELLRRTLFLTGDLASHDVARFAERCRTAIMTKPFLVAELLQRLHQLARSEIVGPRIVGGSRLASGG